MLDSYGRAVQCRRNQALRQKKTIHKKEEDLPNIIVMMNESFSDLSVLGDFETNEDYMPFIHSLEQGRKIRLQEC